MLTETTVVHAAYRVLKKIAEGEVGEVYKAERKANGEVCVLKVLNREWMGDSRLVEGFKREADRARSLKHPNAVRVEDVGEAEDGRPFVVMEHVAGETLGQVMAREGRLPVERTCSVARQVAAVLEVAHAQGIVHQDVTPSHVMLLATPKGEQVKLLGCCIARIKEDRRRDIGRLALRPTGSLMGTPVYFSPEMATGKRELDDRSDLYSLGVLLYQMLSGELPFEDTTTPMNAVLAHLLALPRPLRGVPDRLAELVRRMLEKKPDLRPAGARVVVEELESVEALLRAVSAPALSASLPDEMKQTVAEAAELKAEPVATAPLETLHSEAAPSQVGEVALKDTSQGLVQTPTPVARPQAGGLLAVRAAARQSNSAAPGQAARERRKSRRRWPRWAMGLAMATVLLALVAWFLEPLRSKLAPYFESTPAAATPPAPRTSSPAAVRPAVGAASRASPDSAGIKPAAAKPQRRDQTGNPGSLTRSAKQPKPAPRHPLDLATLRALTAEGDALFRRGEYDRAIESYGKALRLDPASESLHSKILRARSAKAAEEKYLNE